MGDLKAMFGNKYVLIGGVAIGAMILFVNHNASNSGSGSSVGTSTTAISPAYTSAVMAYNTVAAQEVTKQASIAAQVAMARSSNDVALHIKTLDTISNIDTNNSNVTKQAYISQQGIIQTQLQSAASVAIDYSNNAARLGQAQQQTQQVIAQSNAAVAVAQEQAKAAKNASMWGALGSIGKAVGSTVAAFA